MLLDLTENFKVQGSAVIGFWSKKKLDLISARILDGGDQRKGNSQGQSGQRKVKR